MSTLVSPGLSLGILRGSLMFLLAWIVTGVVGSLGLMDLLGNSVAYFPLRNIGIVTIPLAFLVGIAVSLLTHERSSEQDYAELHLRTGGAIGR
jgi:Na+(H+)/acetate symporter ActP